MGFEKLPTESAEKPEEKKPDNKVRAFRWEQGVLKEVPLSETGRKPNIEDESTRTRLFSKEEVEKMREEIRRIEEEKKAG